VSLYADYIRERLGKSCYEVEQGFTVYWYTDDAVYIEDIYVADKWRKTKVASQMADYIADEARAIGVNKMIGSVNTQANNATTSLKVLLGYGMEVSHVIGSMIYFIKDLEK